MKNTKPSSKNGNSLFIASHLQHFFLTQTAVHRTEHLHHVLLWSPASAVRSGFPVHMAPPQQQQRLPPPCRLGQWIWLIVVLKPRPRLPLLDLLHLPARRLDCRVTAFLRMVNFHAAGGAASRTLERTRERDGHFHFDLLTIVLMKRSGCFPSFPLLQFWRYS